MCLIRCQTLAEIVCGIPKDGVNTTAVIVTEPLTVGQTYTYSCISGYRSDDTLTVLCKQNGQFSSDGPTCYPKGWSSVGIDSCSG